MLNFIYFQMFYFIYSLQSVSFITLLICRLYANLSLLVTIKLMFLLFASMASGCKLP